MKADIQQAIKEAMKAREKVRLETLRSILSAIQYQEMQKEVDALSEADSLAVLKSEIKKRNEELEFAEKAERPEAIEKLKLEMAAIEDFLPSQLSEQDLEKIITDLKAENDALNMGLAMKALKESYAGQYDGKLASEIAKRLLS